MSSHGKSFSVPEKFLGKLMDSEEPLASSCQSFPLVLNPGCTYLGLSDCMDRLNLRGTRINVPHQYVVLGDGDVVGMHGKPDALFHLRGESPRLAGALTPLLPRAPEQMGTERDRVNRKPGWEGEDNPGTWEEQSFSLGSQHCTSDRTSWKTTLMLWSALTPVPAAVGLLSRLESCKDTMKGGRVLGESPIP